MKTFFLIVVCLFAVDEYKQHKQARDKLCHITHVIKYSQGGVNKRIDENKALLQLILTQPRFTEMHPWVKDQIDLQEQYFSAIAVSADITGADDAEYCKKTEFKKEDK